MIKYLREKPENIRRAPAHHLIQYIHGLDPVTPSTLEEYLNIWKRQESEFGRDKWDDEMEKEAIEGLDWLVENGLALTVHDE